MKILSEICYYLGFGSILLANYFWFQNTTDYLTLLHNEHQALFVGLWAPTFFILSKILNDK